MDIPHYKVKYILMSVKVFLIYESVILPIRMCHVSLLLHLAVN